MLIDERIDERVHGAPVARRLSRVSGLTRLAAALTVAAGSLVGCSAGGSADGSNRSTPSTTADAGDRTAEDPTTTLPIDPATAPDPDVDDVADDTFRGLGDPRIDVTHYDVTVTADPGDPTVTGTATLTLAARTAEPLTSFTLDLRALTVRTVTVDGAEAAVSRDGAELTIEPVGALAPGEPVEVTLTYGGTPVQTEFPGLGVPVGWQPDDDDGWFTMSEPDGTSNWAPVSDHPSDKATWTLTLDTPADVTGVGNGKLVSSTQADGRRRWVWEQSEPMATYLVLAAVGDYDLVQREATVDVDHVGDGPLEVTFAFPRSLGAERREGFDDLDGILAFYADTFGPYPDDDAGAIVVSTELGLALENQTRPMFGLDAVGEGEVWALAHELGHQWFGDAVTLSSWPDLWLNEGFATYADWLWQDHVGEVSIDDQAEATQGSVDGEAPVGSPEAAGSFSPAVYEGGALTLHALRKTVGDDAFFEILRTWVAVNDGASVSTDDFVALAEDVSGRDLESFFAAWLDQQPQPALPD